MTDTITNPAAFSISGVMPCRNEAAFVRSAVMSLLRQRSPLGGFELIVVDGRSTDGSREILDEIASQDTRVRILENALRITPAAMNIGVKAARGRYVAILGSHNRYGDDYLDAACTFLDSHPEVDNVGGCMFVEGEGLVQRAIALAFSSSLGSGGARWHSGHYEGPADTVFGGVYRREVFDRIGYFDEALVRNQDDEFNLRLIRSGGTIWQSASMCSWYSPRASLGGLFRQYEQYGYWKIAVIKKHGRPASVRHLIPGTFVAALGLLALLATVSRVAAWGFGALLAGYAVVLAGGSLVAAAGDVKVLTVLPAVFLCQHFGYGMGSLAGLVQAVFRRRSGSHRYEQSTRSEEGRGVGEMRGHHSSERLRLLKVYAQRDTKTGAELYAPTRCWNLFLIQQRTRRAMRVLSEADLLPLRGRRILEVGCGHRGWLADFELWGARRADLFGIDLVPGRAEECRRVLSPHRDDRGRELSPGAHIVVGDASMLPWPDEVFDLVVLSTVLTSILDPSMRHGVAREAIRVLRRGGCVLLYDFAVDNPKNHDVRAVSRREVARLFESCEIVLRRTTLAPPVARIVVPVSWIGGLLLESIGFFNTHLIGTIRKPTSSEANRSAP
jgi:succinoglycan biosynthesis protein ExoA